MIHRKQALSICSRQQVALIHRCDRSMPHVREQCYIPRAGQAADMSFFVILAV